MRLFCKALDSILGVTTSPCVGDLGGLFQTNAALLQGKGVLLPNETDTGQSRKRQRNENSWAYIAQKYERLEFLKKKAAKSNISLDELQRGKEQKEKEKQRAKRQRVKEMRVANRVVGVATDGETNRGAVSPAAQAVVRDGAEIGAVMNALGARAGKSLSNLLT